MCFDCCLLSVRHGFVGLIANDNGLLGLFSLFEICNAVLLFECSQGSLAGLHHSSLYLVLKDEEIVIQLICSVGVLIEFELLGSS
jgi:hypothetical protein